MDSVAVTVPLRPPTKKMKKRKELDALAPSHVISRRTSGKRSSQELLTDSSDERSEYWSLTTRGTRKCRSRRSRACPGLLRACSAFFACASILATASLIWLFIDVRQQLTALRTELDQVRAGSAGVPDELQKCHSLSRDLQNNQTTIFTQLSELKLQINNFTAQLSVMQQGLHQAQDFLQGAPELTNVPKNIKELSHNVASFGSQIRDLVATVNKLKETNAKLQDVQTSLQQNITHVQHSMLDLSNVTQVPESPTRESMLRIEALGSSISQLASNLSTMNKTLSQNITWIAQDQVKDHKILVNLQDTTQNSSMKVMSLQEECAKASEQTNLIASVKKLNDQMSELRSMDVKLKQLEQSYNVLNRSAGVMQTSISDMKNRQLQQQQQQQQQQQKSVSVGSQISSRVSPESESSTIPVDDHGIPDAHENPSGVVSSSRKLFTSKSKRTSEFIRASRDRRLDARVR